MLHIQDRSQIDPYHVFYHLEKKESFSDVPINTYESQNATWYVKIWLHFVATIHLKWPTTMKSNMIAAYFLFEIQIDIYSYHFM